MLFKLDSTNEAFIEKIFGRKPNGIRTKYLEILAGTGILDEYPPAARVSAIKSSIYRRSTDMFKVFGFLTKREGMETQGVQRKVGPVPIGKTTAVLVVADDQVVTANGLPEISNARLLPFQS
jgi:hypothetical protein